MSLQVVDELVLSALKPQLAFFRTIETRVRTVTRRVSPVLAPAPVLELGLAFRSFCCVNDSLQMKRDHFLMNLCHFGIGIVAETSFGCSLSHLS